MMPVNRKASRNENPARFENTPTSRLAKNNTDAVSKGTIDGFALPWEVIPAFKLQEMVKFHTQTDPSRPALYSAVFVFAMNQAKYDSLPADLKKVIDDNSGIQLAALFGRAMDEGDKVGLDIAQKAKNNIVALDLAETQRWRRTAGAVETDWVAEMKGKNIDGVKLAAEARALIAKHSK